MSHKKNAHQFLCNETYREYKKRVRISLKRIVPNLTQINSEDVAHEMFVQWLSGKSQKQTVDQFVVDYLRKNVGHKGTGVYQQRQRFFSPTEWKGNKRRDDMGADMGDGRLFNEYKHLFSERERVIFGLYIKWGLKQKEIGELFGINDARVCQIFSKIQARIKRFCEKQKDTN